MDEPSDSSVLQQNLDGSSLNGDEDALTISPDLNSESTPPTTGANAPLLQRIIDLRRMNQFSNFSHSLNMDLAFFWMFAVAYPNLLAWHLATSTRLFSQSIYCCTFQWICCMMSSLSSFCGCVDQAWLLTVLLHRIVVYILSFAHDLEVLELYVPGLNWMALQVFRLMKPRSSRRVLSSWLCWMCLYYSSIGWSFTYWTASWGYELAWTPGPEMDASELV